MIRLDQQERLRAAYELFVQRAAEEQDLEGKEQVDRLLRQVYEKTRPAGRSTLSALPFTEIPTVDPELADMPELAYAWGALHEALPDIESPSYGRADSPALEAYRRRRLPVEEPEEITVLEDGGLLGAGRYQILDPNWIEGTICWLSHLFDKAPLQSNAPVVSMPDRFSLGLAGDWGVGPHTESRGSENVARVLNALECDYTVHLGDVYYAGTDQEIQQHFLAHWPVGKLGSLALNSNHEMYSGGRGYFGITLQQDAFAAQQGASFFALENEHWVIVGLDSAYDANRFKLYRTGRLGDEQLDFLSRRVDALGDRKLLLMSHHQGLELDGEPSKKLWGQVLDVLAGTPAVWYWGHLHAAVAYRTRDGITGRCCGHGGMPRGRAKVLDDKGAVVWFGQRPAEDPAVPPRVANGLAHLRFDGPRLHEVFYDEWGTPMWWSWDPTSPGEPTEPIPLTVELVPL